MRTLRTLPLLMLLAGCSSQINVGEVKPKLKGYLTEQMRKAGWRDIRTDEDSRARPPTKYADATKGVLFTLRHAAKFDGNPGTVCTWVFSSAAARDASKNGPYNAITDDLNRENKYFKLYSFNLGELPVLMLVEAPSLSLANQFQMLERALTENLAEMK